MRTIGYELMDLRLGRSRTEATGPDVGQVLDTGIHMLGAWLRARPIREVGRRIQVPYVS